jgi:hypothetical protein
MSQFAPCPACNRHVVTVETACPFCATALPDSFRAQAPAPRPPGRISRAAMLAALVTAGACSDALPPPPPAPAYGVPAPADAAVDSGTLDGGAMAIYGAPAPATTQES